MLFDLSADPAVRLIVTLVLAYVFLTAGWHKCRAPEEFAVTLANYKVLPEALTRQGVYLFPVAELMTGASLLVPSTRSVAVLAAGGLLCVYIVAIGINLLRGRHNIDCGCGGPAQKQTLSEWMLARNGLLLLLVFIANGPAQPRALLWIDNLTVLLAAVTGCLFYNTINHLLANRDVLQPLARGSRQAGR